MKKILIIVLALILTLTLSLPSVTLAYWTESETLTMYYYDNLEEYCCGPKSGVSIGWYYKTHGYSGLPQQTELEMFWDLHEYMQTNIWGGTGPQRYANGFVEMTIKEGNYFNFSYVYDDDVTDEDKDSDGFADDFRDIVDAINNGWPVALEGGFRNVDYISMDGEGPWPPTWGHYIAIKGYSYRTNGSSIWDRRIVCTDNYSGSDNISFSWDEVVNVGIGLITIVIKDELGETVIEDFEWGSDGASLDTSGGEVEWTVSTQGNSVIEIDTAKKHSGIRSGRFYCDGSYTISASYQQQCNPISIGFWLMKDDNSFPSTLTSNGVHQIKVRVDGSETLQYGRGSYMYNICPFSANVWHLVEFRNIDWYDDFTYDIYVDGLPKKLNTPMDTSIYDTGRTVYYALSGTYGSFWIDDIPEAPEATIVELLPETDSNPVDTTHDLTATVYDQFGYEMGGVAVTWSINGVGSFSGTPESPTDANGQADAVITSSVPGTSTVSCEVTGNPSVCDTATKDWTYTPEATTLELWPEAGENPVDTTHELTATVYDQFGSEMENVAVTWSIDGVGSFSGTPESPTDANGQADAVITSSVPGTSTVRCELTPSVYDTATKDWTYTPEATTLELLPEAGENPVDTTHNLTATVYDQFSYVMEGVDVTWNISGVGSFSGTPDGVTDADGQADAVITSSFPGTSTVRCEVTGNPSVSDTATKDWTYTPEAMTLELLPETGENPVDTTHNLTATVYDQFSYVMEGVDVTWNISGVGSFSGTPDGVTDADGQADAVITSSFPGTSTVRCEVTGNPSVSDTATKDWTYTPEAMTLELLPETGENPVDTTHNLKATVYDQYGYEMEGVAVNWSISGVGSFSGTPEGVTDVDGQADAVITSSVLGASTVRCEVTGNPSVYDTATKDWTYLEDFEWGNDGDSLGMDGGNIDWTVETDGSSVAEIDTAQAQSGTRSGRFYYDGSSENILAYYSQDSPTSRGFYLRKDKNAVAYTITGDGTNAVLIRVAKNEFVQCYDGSWNNVCKISDKSWYFIEFRNIDWVAATYDIYVDNDLENSDTPMSASSSYNGLTAYYGGDYEGEFWIDDILK